MKLLLLLILVFLTNCAVTSHRVIKSQKTSSHFNENPTVKIAFQKIKSASWQIDRSGLIDLDDPKAIAAGLGDGLEPIDIYFYVIDHPNHGRFLIDSGVANSITDNDKTPIPWIMRKMMNFEAMVVHQSTATFVADSAEIKGVFLTHMHADHILGLPDLPKGIKIYVGPKEATFTHMRNLPVQGVTDALLTGHGVIEELGFEKTGAELAVLDFFGDGSFLVYSSPGHTPGSLAFLINGKDQTHLVVGDTCHTSWGWQNTVTPGEFTLDHAENLRSLKWLKDLAIRKQASVHLGHQSL